LTIAGIADIAGIARNRKPKSFYHRDTKGRRQEKARLSRRALVFAANLTVELGLLATEAAEVGGFIVFASGDEEKHVMVGEGAKAFSAIAVVLKEAGGKDAASGEAVFGGEFVEGGEGDAVSTIKVAESFKELGFHLVVSAVGL
jgi:hypothetical protein